MKSVFFRVLKIFSSDFSCFREVNKFGLRIESVKRHLFHLCGPVQIIECFVERNLFAIQISKSHHHTCFF